MEAHLDLHQPSVVEKAYDDYIARLRSQGYTGRVSFSDFSAGWEAQEQCMRAAAGSQSSGD